MRFLNEHFGPRMNDWRWGGVHNGHYETQLLKHGLFEDNDSNKLVNIPIAGGNSTIYKGSFTEKEGLSIDSVSCLSGIFTDKSFYLSPGFTCPANPQSEYHKNYHINKEFIHLGKEKNIHNFRILKQGAGESI